MTSAISFLLSINICSIQHLCWWNSKQNEHASAVKSKLIASAKSSLNEIICCFNFKEMLQSIFVCSLLQSKHLLEADIQRMQEEIKMMEQQYKEAVDDNGESAGASQNNLSETVTCLTQQTNRSKGTLQSAESNILEKGDVEGNNLDQANIETVDPNDTLPEALEPSNELASDQTSSCAHFGDKKIASSCSQVVVQESDQEELNSPVKENTSQRSRLSLSGRKKRKISVSDTDSAPACTSTPKADTELNREVRSSAKKTEAIASPLKNCTPIIQLNKTQGKIRMFMYCIR